MVGPGHDRPPAGDLPTQAAIAAESVATTTGPSPARLRPAAHARSWMPAMSASALPGSRIEAIRGRNEDRTFPLGHELAPPKRSPASAKLSCDRGYTGCRGEANRVFVRRRYRPHRAAHSALPYLPRLRPEIRWTHFERNKILGAILGTALVLIARRTTPPGGDIRAGSPPSPATTSRFPKAAHRTGASAATDKAPVGEQVATADPKRRGPHYKAKPATPSTRAVTTPRSAPTSTGSSDAARSPRRADYSSSMKVAGNWTIDDLYLTSDATLVAVQGTKMTFAGTPGRKPAPTSSTISTRPARTRRKPLPKAAASAGTAPKAQ